MSAFKKPPFWLSVFPSPYNQWKKSSEYCADFVPQHDTSTAAFLPAQILIVLCCKAAQTRSCLGEEIYVEPCGSLPVSNFNLERVQLNIFWEGVQLFGGDMLRMYEVSGSGFAFPGKGSQVMWKTIACDNMENPWKPWAHQGWAEGKTDLQY